MVLLAIMQHFRLWALSASLPCDRVVAGSPLMRHFDVSFDALNSPQYNAGTTSEVGELLKSQKAETPSRIPYLMCRRGVPGYLNLMFIPGNR